MRSKIHLLLATSLLASGAAGAQTRAPTANEAIELARRNARASEQEAAKNLDERKDLYRAYRDAIQKGDTAEAMRILKDIQGDLPKAGSEPGALQIVYGPGFAGAVPVPVKAKAPPAPAPKAPGPKKAPPKKEEEADRRTTQELKRDLDATRRALDEALRRRDEARIPRDTISERDRQQQIRETNEESQRLYQQVKDADARYRRRLQQEDPAEYERYDREQRDITRRDFERGPMDMRDAMQPPKTVPAPRETAPPLRDYDGPSGTESSRRLEGGQDPSQPGRVIAPGLSKDPGGKAPAPPLRDYDGPQGTNPGDRLSGGADGGQGPVLAPGLGNTPPPSGPKR